MDEIERLIRQTPTTTDKERVRRLASQYMELRQSKN